MKSNKLPIIIAGILLFMSFNCLAIAIVFYQLEDKVTNFRYSDVNEYNIVHEGTELINKLPIQFNIINQYFGSFDNLEEETRQKILMGYALKNRIHTYECGIGNNSLCIKVEDLKTEELSNTFHTKTEFKLEEIKIYMDDYGPRDVKLDKENGVYTVELDNDNNFNRKYTKFSHYQQLKDSYIFYVYEGFYKANCTKGEIIDLQDFLTGDIIYSNICDENHGFKVEKEETIKNLQLYKYELKKDKNNQLYIAGYNPVRG